MRSPKSPALVVGCLAALAAVVAATVIYLLAKPAALPAPSSSALAKPEPGTAPASIVYEPHAIGFAVKGHPMISNLAVADLDQDGLMDVIVTDGESNRVSWIRQFPRGVFTEEALGDLVPGPAHVSVCDLNGDGKLDLLVASMGVIMPNDDRIGSVVVLENLGGGRFRNRVLIDKIMRVTDVRGADLNGDGLTDLVVGQFGFVTGEIRWMEALGDWKFASHRLLNAPGTIHTPVADFNVDGRLDFAALVSQDEEKVMLFTNRGSDYFPHEVLWQGPNPSWNSSGLEACDLDHDGKPDLLYTNGDGFDGAFASPVPWHGLQWLHNEGGGRFTYRRIGDLPGCYNPVAADLNGDGHLDIVTVSAFSNANDTTAVSLMAWINDGAQNFRAVPLAHAPTHLITAAAGDLDGNGVPVIVTGGFFAFPPFTEMSRVTLWRQKK